SSRAAARTPALLRRSRPSGRVHSVTGAMTTPPILPGQPDPGPPSRPASPPDPVPPLRPAPSSDPRLSADQRPARLRDAFRKALPDDRFGDHTVLLSGTGQNLVGLVVFIL